MGRVVIGDGSAQAVGDEHCGGRGEQLLDQGRYTTDASGYRQMLTVRIVFPDRIWAVEDYNGVVNIWPHA